MRVSCSMASRYVTWAFVHSVQPDLGDHKTPLDSEQCMVPNLRGI